MRKLLLLTIVLGALALTGCQTAAVAVTPAPVSPTPEAVMTDEPMTEEADTMTDEPMTEEAMTEEAAASADTMARPDWHNLTLTNARTGATFTLADFAGQTVLVEPMATWCSNCRAQLGNVASAAQQLDGQPVTFIALSVAENISDADLAAYAERQSFPFIFAVATPELLSALTENFGRAAITPPSTPHFIIAPDGSVSDLFTGSKNSADLVTLLTAAGA
jgi:cytochrome oxidase Cu insertion factor (SCO1/SenC/PrrC family)